MMPMPNKLPKFLDNHKICIICEGNEEYEYLNRLKNLKIWNEQYDISLVNAGGTPADLENGEINVFNEYFFRDLSAYYMDVPQYILGWSEAH